MIFVKLSATKEFAQLVYMYLIVLTVQQQHMDYGESLFPSYLLLTNVE